VVKRNLDMETNVTIEYGYRKKWNVYRKILGNRDIYVKEWMLVLGIYNGKMREKIKKEGKDVDKVKSCLG
jgi:hypothetical protein